MSIFVGLSPRPPPITVGLALKGAARMMTASIAAVAEEQSLTTWEIVRKMGKAVSGTAGMTANRGKSRPSPGPGRASTAGVIQAEDDPFR